MMFGILKRLSQVLLVIVGIAFYFYQVYLWYNLGVYINEKSITLLGIFPLWVFIPYGIHALISWIIAGEIYTTKEYKELYKKIKKYKTIKTTKKDKAQKQAGNLSIVKKDDTGGLSIL